MELCQIKPGRVKLCQIEFSRIQFCQIEFCQIKLCPIRQCFKTVAREILTDVLQILVPRLFVPLNLRVTLITLYQGPPTPGDSIPAASLRRPCGNLTADVVWRAPRRATFGASLGSFGPTCAPTGPIGPRLGALWPPLTPIRAACGPQWLPFGPHFCPIGLI